MTKLEKEGEIMTVNQNFLNKKGEKNVRVTIDFLFERVQFGVSNRMKNDCALSSFQIFPSNIIAPFFKAGT